MIIFLIGLIAGIFLVWLGLIGLGILTIKNYPKDYD